MKRDKILKHLFFSAVPESGLQANCVAFCDMAHKLHNCSICDKLPTQ